MRKVIVYYGYPKSGNGEIVQPMGIETKKYDLEIIHADSPGVLIVGSVAC